MSTSTASPSLGKLGHVVTLRRVGFPLTRFGVNAPLRLSGKNVSSQSRGDVFSFVMGGMRQLPPKAIPENPMRLAETS